MIFRSNRVVGALGSDVKLSRKALKSLARKVVRRLRPRRRRARKSSDVPSTASARTFGELRRALASQGAKHGRYAHELKLSNFKLGPDDGDGWFRGDGDIWIAVKVKETCGEKSFDAAVNAFGEFTLGPFASPDPPLDKSLYEHQGERPHPANEVSVIVKDSDEGDLLDILGALLPIAETAATAASEKAAAEALKLAGETVDKLKGEKQQAKNEKTPDAFESVGKMRGDVVGQGLTTFNWPHGSGPFEKVMAANLVDVTFGGSYREEHPSPYEPAPTPCD